MAHASRTKLVTVTKLKSGIASRSVALAIPRKLVMPLSRDIVKWYVFSGEEWTVDRLKAIKLDIIRQKAGLQPVSTWISRTHRGNLRGAFGTLEEWMLRKEKNFSKGLQFLQSYTMFYAPRITEKQKNKFLDGVLSIPPRLPELSLAMKALDKGYELIGSLKVGILGKPSPLEMMMPSPSKRAPLPDGSVTESEGIVDSIMYLYDTFEGIRHLNHYYDSHYKHALRNVEPYFFNDYGHFMSDKGYPKALSDHGSLLAGRIGLIQEPGYKLRAVANPGRIFQRVLRPLGENIYSQLRDFPWDCTFDQSKSIPFIQDRLSQSKMSYSIDLTGATDYFPLHIQEHLLRKIYPKLDVDLFVELSTSSWTFPDYGEVSWKRGQPLGLYPSFAAFALTHGLLLLGLLGRPYNNEFFVLGDDVVILDDQLAQDYLEMMNLLGCPVSTSKTISSNSLSEFAGKVVTSKRVIPQLKWRDVSDDSFLDIAKLLGPQSISLFRPRQIKIIKEIGFIPDFLGGLGWNPDGLPLEERVKSSLIWPDRRPVDRLMGYSSLVIKNLFGSRLFGLVALSSIGKTKIDIENADLDQRSSLLVKTLMGKTFKSFPKGILGKNVDMVNYNLLGYEVDLPFNPGEGESLLPSLLESWEAKLKHLR